ncbi:hypothetical protein, partial [Mesorhizobium sp. M5C.F.Ca.ET.164.01.1.1]|uniref:hypothetical protein n=1 Tax=Mesorhizobium sp. M5C.F.Ca.ET.164.01.1.1 TaxID=2563957 RepID=UPI001AEDE590
WLSTNPRPSAERRQLPGTSADTNALKYRHHVGLAPGSSDPITRETNTGQIYRLLSQALYLN